MIMNPNYNNSYYQNTHALQEGSRTALQEGSKTAQPIQQPEILNPEVYEDGRIIDPFRFFFSQKQGFEVRLNMQAAGVNSGTRVFASITEVFGPDKKPGMGLASCEVHNVVPHDDGIVIVRGFIGWESNIWVRLSMITAL